MRMYSLYAKSAEPVGPNENHKTLAIHKIEFIFLDLARDLRAFYDLL